MSDTAASSDSAASQASADPVSPSQPAAPIALVGCAHIHTPRFVEILKQRTDVRVTAVWDHDAARARKWADDLGGDAAGVRVVEDIKAVWKDKSLRAAIIGSETNHHQTLVMAGAKAKKHLFVEKPLGMGSKDAYAMAAAIEKAGVQFQTGYFRRSDPIVLFLRDLLHRGSFGQVTRAHISVCHGAALKGWFDGDYRWMADPAAAGVGGFGDLGTHGLDLLLFLFGEVSKCTALIGNGTGKYPGVDDGGEGLLQFTSGTIGTLAAGWDAVADPVTIQISGTQGHATVINGQLFLQCESVPGADGKQPWEKLAPRLPGSLDLFLDNVADPDRHAPVVSAREAAYRSAVMEAMYEGARKEKWVTPKAWPTPRQKAAAVEPQEMMPPASTEPPPTPS